MATQTKLVSMAKQFSGLPMKELIGAPLVAASEANNMMALSQTKFLLGTCFELKKEGDNEVHKPVMINMTVTRAVLNPDGSEAEPIQSDLSLPLLTIIPINSLAVDEMNFSFEMEVKSSFESNTEAVNSNEQKQQEGISKTLSQGSVSAELSGTVATSEKSDINEQSNYKKSNAAKYEINAHAGQLPLPVGITTIIDTYANAVAPIQLKQSAERVES